MSEFQSNNQPEDSPLPIPEVGQTVYVSEGSESYPWQVSGTRTIDGVIHVVVWRQLVSPSSVVPEGDISKYIPLEDYWKLAEAHSATDTAISGLERSIRQENS